MEFPAIGSLLDDQDTLGPLSRSCSYPSLLSLDCGPFKTTKEYLLANVSAELKLVQENPENWRKQRNETANLSGGLEDTLIEDAREWLRLLHEGIRGLRNDLLDPPENPFVFFHDDFQWSNVLVSPEDPTKLVGILDWEGSRVLPVWDNSRLADPVGRNIIDDPEELRRLQDMKWDILQDVQTNVAYSKHRWHLFLRIIDYGHSFRSRWEVVDGLFLGWLESVRGKGLWEDVDLWPAWRNILKV